MTIEEEIKQKKFSSEYQKLSVNILFTASFLSSHISKLLKPHGLSMEQFNVLRILRGQYPNPASINLICERMIDRASNASRIVEKLRAKNLVERKEAQHDRRLVDITITEAGLQVLQRADTDQAAMEQILSTLSVDEACALNQLLDKLRG